jgi:Icc-related predicted phosphoesterase
MRIVCISDTHEQERSVAIPACDLLIHAGDITFKGDLHKLAAFDDWCEALPLPRERILVCAGNHDISLEKTPEVATHAFLHCTYVRDATVVIDGAKIYMSPWQPRFNDWAFNLDRGSKELAARWDAIPAHTDIVVTHGPAYGFGDLTVDGLRVGCELLLQRLGEIRPRFHICGHVHEGYGVYQTGFGTTVVNASVCNARYQPIHPAIVIDFRSRTLM